MKPSRILTVRLPCRKIFPIGPIYLMGAIRRADPQLSQRLLDLALVEPKRRMSTFQEVIKEYRPDVISFSWRDIQVFSPHDMDAAMRDAFVFFHDPLPWRRMVAAFKGLGHILAYHSGIAENLHLIRAAEASSPRSLIVVGGPSIRIFGERFRPKLPPRVQLYSERSLNPFLRLLGLPSFENPLEPDLDLETLESDFPEWSTYREDEIGVQTKQGCPHNCLYCLYGFLEGREVQRREPAKVVKEMKAYYKRWGSRKFWFADSQLLCDADHDEHLSMILEGLLTEGLEVSWSGYLRMNKLDQQLANLMVRTGLRELEISLNSGSQIVLDELRMGFSVEEMIKGCEVLQKAGYLGRVLVNLSLNAPGETRETLVETIKIMHRIRSILGEYRVIPVIFFLAIQPNTGLEDKALKDGYVRERYNPLSTYPWDVRKLIYNPPPLDKLVGRCCARAFRSPGAMGTRILAYLEEELSR